MIHVNKDHFLSTVYVASYFGLKDVLNQNCALFVLLRMQRAAKQGY